ncbi:MAG: hypothetical protein NZ898_12365, partial [Myxococcota bacterium]|nr:hypothetical protein [Myxococcota bacterium]
PRPALRGGGGAASPGHTRGPRGPAAPPRPDAGAARDAGSVGPDGSVARDAGASVDAGAARDSGSGPSPGGPRPGDGVRFIHWPEQHGASHPSWGEVLTDIVRHLPRSYGDTYYDDDKITYGHETTHGINSHIRNYLNDTGRRANGFYVLENRGVLIVEPPLRKSDANPYVPASLRGDRYDLYMRGSAAWDDTPTYIFDEWVAYTNGGAVGVDRVRRGLWREGWRDGVAGQLEFTVYAMALGMAVEARAPDYWRTETQFREFLAWNARRAMQIFREGRTMEPFRWDRQDRYYEALRTSPDAAALRAFIVRAFGEAFAAEVFEITPAP